MLFVYLAVGFFLLLGVLYLVLSPEEWKVKIFSVIIVLVIIGIGGGLWYLTHKDNDKKWNDGCCPECGASWELVTASPRWNNVIVKYYVCSECGEEIEIYE